VKKLMVHIHQVFMHKSVMAFNLLTKAPRLEGRATSSTKRANLGGLLGIAGPN
jgi:hypothetical protein